MLRWMVIRVKSVWAVRIGTSELRHLSRSMAFQENTATFLHPNPTASSGPPSVAVRSLKHQQTGYLQPTKPSNHQLEFSKAPEPQSRIRTTTQGQAVAIAVRGVPGRGSFGIASPVLRLLSFSLRFWVRVTRMYS